MIKTILCDLGNVIVYVDHNKIIKGLAKHTNKQEQFIYHFFYHSTSRKSFEKGKISAGELFTDYKKKLNLRLNFNQFKKIWCSCFTGENKELADLIRKLKKKYRLVLLSNTDEMHFPYIKKKCRVLDVFDDFVLSYKAGYKKPNPMIFLKAIKKSKTTPSQIIYIDDTYQYVFAAKFFGIKSFQYKVYDELRRDLRLKGVKL